MVKIGTKIEFLAHFERFFVYAVLHPMILVTPQDFASWKTLLRYIFVVRVSLV